MKRGCPRIVGPPKWLVILRAKSRIFHSYGATVDKNPNEPSRWGRDTRTFTVGLMVVHEHVRYHVVVGGWRFTIHNSLIGLLEPSITRWWLMNRWFEKATEIFSMTMMEKDICTKQLLVFMSWYVPNVVSNFLIFTSPVCVQWVYFLS